MKHGVAFRGLSRTSSHRMLMLRNMVSSLLEHGQIKTTEAKAKETARLAEKMITLGKKGDEHSKRQAAAFLLKHDITIPLLFNEYGPRYAERPGGYTRIHRYGNRPGDNAPHAVIELVDGPKDLKFEITARAVGRETVERYLVNGEFNRAGPSVEGEADVPRKRLLRPMTELNVLKALRYRSQADKELFQQRAATWANRILAEPSLLNGIRRRVEPAPKVDIYGDPVTESEEQMRKRKGRVAFAGKRHLAGERLLGVPDTRATSALAIARGALAKRGKPPTSQLWEKASSNRPTLAGSKVDYSAEYTNTSGGLIL